MVLTKKEIREWIQEALKKKYDRDDINDLLASQYENGKIDKESWLEVLKEYDKEKEEVEGMKIGIIAKFKLKRRLKKLKSAMLVVAEQFDKLSKLGKNITKDQKKDMEELRKKMIVAITGNKDKEIEGLINIFDVRDEKGNEVTKEILETYSIEDLNELLTELVNMLEKEI